MLVPLLFAAMIGYLLGSLPFGYLIARAKGVNIFEVGSKNPGATNVKRVLGKGPGNLVFFLDVVKGAVAAGWPLLANLASPAAVAGLVGALFGHSFSCFTKFKGGKGMATAAGGFLVLLPVETLIAGAVWIIAFYASRYVSLASILAAAALPTATLILTGPSLLSWFASLVALFIIFRHHANIARLLNGTENKFVKKKEESAA